MKRILSLLLIIGIIFSMNTYSVLAQNTSGWIVFSENFNEVDTTPKSKAHIPDMRHPWKMEQFRKQQRRARLQHLYA